MQSMDNLEGVGVFVEVAAAGSFAQAAERLRVTRSAVGKAVARLEARLGVRLFHRTTRKLALTDDGQAYYESAQRALAELRAVEAAFDDGRHEPAGRVRISVPVLFGRHCVAPALVELARRHPALDIECVFSDRVLDLPEESIDVAVRIGTLPDSATLVARKLGVQRMCLCAAPSYLALRGVPADVDALMAHAGVVYAHNGRPVPWQLYGPDGTVREVTPRSQLRFDDLQSIADAVLAGAGLAWMPCWLVGPSVLAGRLAIVMEPEQVVANDIHLVWPHAPRLPLRVRAAIDALVDSIPPLLAHRDVRC
jgi:DNA-binding transcriptional LysR family regulator